MKTNKTEVKVIINEFNSISNRLMQAAYADYLDVLRKFCNYIENSELIMEFINNCGGFCQDMENMLDDVISRERFSFKFNIDDNKEASEIYSVIKILCSREYKEIPVGLLFHYSPSSNNFSDKLKEFNHRVVFNLIDHIGDFLKKVGIEMGLDNNVTYNISGTQVNIANDNANINAVQNNNGINADELKKIIEEMRESLDSNLSEEDKDEAIECINSIEAELLSPQPNETTVKDKFKLLKRIDASTKFISACCSVLTFADKLHPFLADIVPFYQALLH